MDRFIRGVLISLVSVLYVHTGHAAQTGTMGLAEGRAASTQCPNKTYLAGFAVQYDAVMSGLHPYCVNMAPDGSWSGGAQIHLDRPMSEANLGGMRKDLFCPMDFYALGFRGKSHVYGVHAIMHFTLTCQNLKTGALWEHTVGPPGNPSLTEWRGDRCADDAVADGVFGLVNGGTIIQFGFSCAQTQPAAKLARTNKKMRMGAAQGLGVFAVPTIQSPAQGARFFSYTSVPIKIAAPKGVAPVSYLVSLERKNAQGLWTLVTNLPVGAAEASSPSGYLGWGAAGSGRGPAMIAGPGTYRVSAQVSSPRQTEWSPPMEFVVTDPNKAIRKAPKMFGR
ncbi:MAG: hypothetical protein P0111_10435 [Nitrospira sp.]|nr:hypothetical protein [Nitrospira sp.]